MLWKSVQKNDNKNVPFPFIAIVNVSMSIIFLTRFLSMHLLLCRPKKVNSSSEAVKLVIDKIKPKKCFALNGLHNLGFAGSQISCGYACSIQLWETHYLLLKLNIDGSIHTMTAY